MITSAKIRKRVEVEGVVQGVGFRPFVYKLAGKFNLTGFVYNDQNGVKIEVEGDYDSAGDFILELKNYPPPLSEIKSIYEKNIPLINSKTFEIKKSPESAGNKTFISPDVSICNDCRRELFDPNDRRFLYPFINCTNCGPRYTIINNIPYDRIHTTMHKFGMCGKCREEYEDPLNRRFHAQPTACTDCGPQIFLDENSSVIYGTKEVISRTVELLLNGKIVAVKGLGGFHLAVDSFNNEAVKELRKRKNREAKPLAVMTDELNTAELIAEVNETGKDLLTSIRKPIVLLKKKENIKLSRAVTGFNKRIGIMLPYTPLHYILMEKLKEKLSGDRPPVLVMTSANLSDEPIVTTNEEAKERLTGIADAYLMHNRGILIRTDDSVTSVVNGKERIIRRSRGYVPKAVSLPEETPSLLGLGTELKNTICITKNNNAFVSQHIGDLTNLRAYNFFNQMMEHLQNIIDIKPEYYVHDLHPNYLSTKWAVENNGHKKFAVQHHHAHMASCMSENNLDENVIGIILDGTGYGYDNTIWGGEVLIGNYTGFERFLHLENYPLPGGDIAVKEPWKIAVSYLYRSFDNQFSFSNIFQNLPVENVIRILDKNINSPFTSSAGRLFDAVSAIAGGPVKIKYEAEAALRLTQAVNNINEKPFDYDEAETLKGIIPLRKLIRSVYGGVQSGLSFNEVAGKFHVTLVNIFTGAAIKAKEYSGINKVVLSGGVFQNEILLSLLEKKLAEEKFEVYTHSIIPSNDGGISLGQVAVASKLIKEKMDFPLFMEKGELLCV